MKNPNDQTVAMDLILAARFMGLFNFHWDRGRQKMHAVSRETLDKSITNCKYDSLSLGSLFICLMFAFLMCV